MRRRRRRPLRRACLVVSVAITGTPEDRAAVLRCEPVPGDVLFVTGTARPLGGRAAERCKPGRADRPRRATTVDGAHRRLPPAGRTGGRRPGSRGRRRDGDDRHLRRARDRSRPPRDRVGRRRRARTRSRWPTGRPSTRRSAAARTTSSSSQPAIRTRRGEAFEAAGLRRADPNRASASRTRRRQASSVHDPLTRSRGWEHRLRRAGEA